MPELKSYVLPSAQEHLLEEAVIHCVYFLGPAMYKLKLPAQNPSEPLEFNL